MMPVLKCSLLGIAAVACVGALLGPDLKANGRVASLTVVPDSLVLNLGDVGVATCQPKSVNGQVLKNTCTWKSTDTNVVRVTSGSQTTTVTARTLGKVTVTASVSGKSAPLIVQVIGTAPPPPPGCTASATTLCPGDDWQAKVNAQGAVTFTVGAGIHRLQSVTAKSGQTFQGEPGAVMSGAKLLTGWTASGATWYVGGQTQEFSHTSGVPCASGTACAYPEDVYRDDVLLHRELTLAAVGAGDFYFDYTADRIYVGDDPTGHKLEGSAVEYAFQGRNQGAGASVTLRGLVVEKYAPAAGMAAIGHDHTADTWIVRDCEIRYNHGMGLRVGHGIVVAHDNIHHNGQMGLGGTGNNARVDSNEVAYNNTAAYQYGWEAGGSKFVQSTGWVTRGNFVHHNDGPGLWWDGDNDNALIENNRVEDNAAEGIFWELSYSGIIRNNTISRNGFSQGSSRDGSGIHIGSAGAESGQLLEIYGNTLMGNKNGIEAVQADRGTGNLGPWVVQNLSVHDNTVTLTATGHQGIVDFTSAGRPALWTTANNHFEHNTYNLQTASAAPFDWSESKTDVQWQAVGNDETGTFTR